MSTPTTFKAGDTVYGEDGQEAEFVAKTGGEYLVRPFYEDEDGPQAGDVRTWHNAFRTPPAPKLDEKAAAAQKRLDELRAKISELESAKYAFDREEKARLDRIKQHDQLADLDRYLAGEMTHYVAIHDYYPDIEVIPVDQTIDSYSNNNGYGLLTLIPQRGWDKKTRWQVTYKVPNIYIYSQTKTVIPCCGEEQAYARAAEILRGYLDQYQAKEPKEWRYADELVKCCQKFAVDVPQWLSDGIAAIKRDALEWMVADQRKKLAEAEGNLVALGAAAGSAS